MILLPVAFSRENTEYWDLGRVAHHKKPTLKVECSMFLNKGHCEGTVVVVRCGGGEQETAVVRGNSILDPLLDFGQSRQGRNLSPDKY
jgi:hypothetical protein